MTDVLQRPYFAPKFRPIHLDRVRRLFAKAELVAIVERITVCRDSTDDKFLEMAVNGRTDLIVTSDLDLLVSNPFRGISIVTNIAFTHAQAR